MSHNLTDRIDTRLAAGAAAAATIFAGHSTVHAAIVYSGVVNITIPGTFAGLYLNMVTGVTGTSAAQVPGHDFNPYYGGHRLFMANTLGNNAVGTGSGIAVANSQHQWFLGPFVGPFSPFITSTNFPTMENFAPGVPGVIGLRFRRESDGMTLYGAASIVKSSNMNTPGTLLWYAFEDSGANFVPAPGALAVLAMGAIGVSGRKRAFRSRTDELSITST